MQACSGVKDHFKDPSTHLVHPCTFVCYPDDPLGSPVDCRELCPEYFNCILGLLTSSVAPPDGGIIDVTYPTDIVPAGNGLALGTMLIILSVTAVVICLVTGVLIFIYMKKRRRVQRLNSTHNDTILDSNTQQVPDSSDSLQRESHRHSLISDQSSRVSIHGHKTTYHPSTRGVTSDSQLSTSLRGPRELDIRSEASQDSGRSAIAPSGAAGDFSVAAPEPSRRHVYTRSSSVQSDHSALVSIGTQTLPTLADDESSSLICPNVNKEETGNLSYPVQETGIWALPDTRQEETLPKHTL